MKVMKAVWLHNKRLCLRDVPMPEPLPGEVLIKVIRSGICNTDIELEKGYYPFSGVLGHEFVGEVIDDDAPEHLKNKIVVGEINCGCGHCKKCSSGLEKFCYGRTVVGILHKWGVHAQYVCLPVNNLLVVPDGISIPDACFIEPLAAALEIQEQIQLKSDDRVAIIGDGKLGLLIAKTLKVNCLNVRVFGHHEEKLALLKNDSIETSTEIDEFDMGSFDIVVECTGSKYAVEDAVNLLRPRGTLVLKSTHEGSTEVNMAPIVVNELTLVGSRCGPFDKAINYLKEKLIRLDGILQKEFPIQEAMQAFDHAKQKGVLKVQLIMHNEKTQ